MITESLIYWITRLDGIKGLISIIGILTIVISIFLTIYYFGTWDGEKCRQRRKKWSYLLLIGILLITINIMIPTTKQMAMIYIVPKISNSEFIEKTGKRFEFLSDSAFNQLEKLLKTEDYK